MFRLVCFCETTFRVRELGCKILQPQKGDVVPEVG
jgi:hypothetical protein